MGLKIKELLDIPWLREWIYLLFIAVVIIFLYQPRISLAIDHAHLIDPNNFILSEQEKQIIQSLPPLRVMLLFGITGTLALLSLLGVAYLIHRRFAARLATTLEHVQQQKLMLQASEAKYRALFDNSCEAFMTLEPPDWRFTSGNAAIVSMFLLGDEEDFICHSPWDLSPELQPDGRFSGEKAMEMIETALRDGYHYFEWTHRRIDGEEFLADVLLTRIDAGGKVILQASVRDISDRKRIEKALRDSEARYRRITEGLTDYQYTVRIENGRAVEVTQSPACEKVTGYTPDEFANDPYLWIQMVAPEDRDLVGNRVQQLLDGMDILPIEHRIVRKDGEMRWVIDTTILYRDASGKLLSYDGVIKDITEAKRAEEALLALRDKLQEQNDALQLTEESLREQNDLLLATEEMLREQIEEYEASQRLLKDSEERFKILSEASFGGIVIHDNGIILECNQVLSDMSGIPVEKLIGMNGFELITPVWHELLMHMKSGLDQRYEVEAIRADGTVFPVAVRGKTIPYKGRIVRVSEFRDITERKQAEEDRRQFEEQFQHAQKLESLGVLAGGIAHDFNNILTVIMGYCYMANEGLDSELEYKEAFQKVEAAGNRAADLCRQMLTYAGKSPMEQTQVNLWLLVDDVVKMLQAAIKKNVTIELGLDRHIPLIKGDTGQIQQIVMNLIINAAEAIDEANGTIRVTLMRTVFEDDCAEYDTFGSAIQAGSYACLEVTDTGCGMNEETQKKIFDPFYTTKFTGRGLGMSAICGIVKSHEGVLQLTSAPGEGTTFKVFFPVSEAEDCLESFPATAVHSRKAGGTILIVEDEQTLRDMGRELLETIGFSALTAQHGQEALEIYHERGSEIEVILLDLVMSVMGGVELYHELRKIAPTLPIIFCSGYGVESVEWVINNDQYAEFVHKPYKPAELTDLIMDMKTASPSFSA